MFKKNTAVTGFVIGKFILTADGAEATTGTPACKRMIDGTGGTLTNSASYDATSGLWKINLAAGDMNGDLIGLAFTLADCQPITYTIKTVTGAPNASGNMPVDIQTIAENPVRDDGHGGLLPTYFDWLAIRSGSTRTVINVNGSNQYKTWVENALKGFMAYYVDPSEGDGTQVPCVILSNTEIHVPGGGGGSITLAGDGLPQAPTGGSISLLLHSHADIVDVLTKTNNLPNSIWQANTRSLTTFGTLANDVAAAVWAAASRTLSGFGTLAADIWTYATRAITGGTITTYTGNTPQTGDAYARIGAPSSASVSADVAAVKARTDKIPEAPAAVGSAMTLQSAEREAIAAALLDLANTIDGKTLRQALQIVAAVLAGKISGAGTGIETFRGLDDQHNRVVVTADITGNRTNVTYP
jgi:hypothetical protein